MLTHADVHKEKCMSVVFVYDCNMCLYLSSVDVTGSSVISAGECTSFVMTILK